MRYYLDTNILVFLYGRAKDELTVDVAALLKDEANLFLVSTVAVQELVHLCQIGKVQAGRKRDLNEATNFLRWLEDTGISLIPVSEVHLRQYAELPLYEDHRDPNDRMIIAQAISDRIPLISSDRKFSRYVREGLDFVFNER